MDSIAIRALGVVLDANVCDIADKAKKLEDQNPHESSLTMVDKAYIAALMRNCASYDFCEGDRSVKVYNGLLCQYYGLPERVLRPDNPCGVAQFLCAEGFQVIHWDPPGRDNDFDICWDPDCRLKDPKFHGPHTLYLPAPATPAPKFDSRLVTNVEFRDTHYGEYNEGSNPHHHNRYEWTPDENDEVHSENYHKRSRFI